MELFADYRKRVYARYTATHVSGQAGGPAPDLDYHRRLYEIHYGDLLPKDLSAPVLELGCGSGTFLHFLRARGHKDVLGVEQDAEHVARAKAAGIAEAVQGDAVETLRARPGAFGCVVANDFLEHFRKDELIALLDLVRAALKDGPDSVIVGKVPNADGLAWGRIRYGDLTHELAFTRNSLNQALSASGFTDVEIHAEEPVVTGVKSLLRWLLWQPFKALIKLYLFAESYGHEGVLLTPNLIFRARAAAPAARPR